MALAHRTRPVDSLRLLALVTGLLVAEARADVPAGAEARQAVAAASTLWVVTVPAWDSTAGTLVPWTREGDSWRAGALLPVTVGHGGLRWGRGLTAPPGTRIKREGDGATPAGLFRVTTLVGEAPAHRGAMPYRQARATTRCVDDPASPRYGQIVEAPAGMPPWASAEHMVREDGLYRLLAVVDHNGVEGGAVPGGGSCIFVHAWSAPAVPTVGCVALDPQTLAALAAKATPPLLVAVIPAPLLPSATAAWGLPVGAVVP